MNTLKKLHHIKIYKTLIVLLTFFVSTQSVLSQKRTDNNLTKKVYDENDVDSKPEYPGGIKALNQFFTTNYKMPDMDTYNGKVIINFIVEIDGTLSDFLVLKDIGYGTGAEATRVFQKSPKWMPGILDGKTVRTLVSFPLTLKSEGN